MPGYPDWRSYWTDVEPRLAAGVAAQRNPQTVAALGQAVGLFGFVTEEPVSKVTRHADEHLKLAPLILELLDLLRGIRAAYDAQAVATLAVSLRTAFEVRCAITFVAKSGDVAKCADEARSWLATRGGSWPCLTPTPPDPLCVTSSRRP
jgi:hypothetical protein